VSARNYQCTNLANCDKALAREVIEIGDSEEPICPECKYRLSPVQEDRGSHRWPIVVVLTVAVIGGLCLGGYFAFFSKGRRIQTVGKADSSSAVLAGPEVVRYPCGLMPASAPDVARLLQYLKQGMNYASQRKPDLAIREFQQVLKIDPAFLGAQMNIGSADLAFRKYPEANTAFGAELKLIGCLKQMNDGQLANFAYMQEVGSQPSNQKKRKQVSIFRERLQKEEADVHYNLACLSSRQRQNSQAIVELEKALANGFNDQKSLQTDPDLQSLRSTAEFKALIAKYKPASLTNSESP